MGDTAGPLFRREFHVSMADVDAAEILFYATPLLWAERLLTDWRRSIGQPVSEMISAGLGSPVVRTQVTYSHPLRLDDPVEATLWFKARTNRSFTVLCRFAAGPEAPVAAEVQITQVTVRRDGDAVRSVPVPEELVSELERRPARVTG
jgi:acyl-CoA thioesterase FadM